MKNLTLLLIAILLGCEQQTQERPKGELSPSLASFIVKDLSDATMWYKNLGFLLDTAMSFPDYGVDINFLKQGDFQLELIAFKDQVAIPKEQLPTPYSNVQGFIKLGFLVDDLDSLVSSYIGSDSSIVAGPDVLPALTSGYAWPSRYFLVTDLDGNYIQFFEGDDAFKNAYNLDASQRLTPFLAMVCVDDFQSSIKWYEQLGFDVIEKLEKQGNQRAILSNNHFVFELGSFNGDISLEELEVEGEMKDKVIRMTKIGFNTSKLDSLYDVYSTTDYKIYHQNIEGDNPYFIAEDPEGNYLQFFGVR